MNLIEWGKNEEGPSLMYWVASLMKKSSAERIEKFLANGWRIINMRRGVTPQPVPKRNL